ncbi:MAG: GatB/YqeY domain-containing protein [Pseudomonadota bacterium]
MEQVNGSAALLDEQTSLRQRILDALAEAEADDEHSVRAATLRLIRCAAKDRDAIARSNGECAGCPEGRLLELLHMMAEQREISAREYDEEGRISEAEREREELEIIRSFIPESLSGDDLQDAVESVVTELEATRLKDVGRCMVELKQRYPGKIDVGATSKVVRQALQ